MKRDVVTRQIATLFNTKQVQIRKEAENEAIKLLMKAGSGPSSIHLGILVKGIRDCFRDVLVARKNIELDVLKRAGIPFDKTRAKKLRDEIQNLAENLGPRIEAEIIRGYPNLKRYPKEIEIVKTASSKERSDVLAKIHVEITIAENDTALDSMKESSKETNKGIDIKGPCTILGQEKCNRNETSNTKQYVFVAHPFRDFPTDDFRRSIQNVSEKIDVQFEYADDFVEQGTILCKICGKIQNSFIALFDITGWNPNVALELGLCFGLKKSAMILFDQSNTENKDVYSDIQGVDRIQYSDLEDLETKLSANLLKRIRN